MRTDTYIFLASLFVLCIVAIIVGIVAIKNAEIRSQRKANMDFARVGLTPPYMERYARDYNNCKFHLIPRPTWWIEDGARRRNLARQGKIK